MTGPARRPLLAGSAAAALALLTACAGAGGPEPGPSWPVPSASPSGSPSASPSTPGPSATAGADPSAPSGAGGPASGTGTDAEPSADALLTVTALRTGTHPGYDRVVVELEGTGTPGWHVERAPVAVEDPTGDTVDLGGEGVLVLYLTGLGYPQDTGVAELAPGTRAPGGTVVTAVELTGTFEGQTQVFLGLTDPQAPYEVSLLRDPLRVVVDVQRSMA